MCQSRVCCFTQPLSLQCLAPISLWAHRVRQAWANGPLGHSVSGHHSSNHPWGESVTAQEFLTKQQPTILIKCMASHMAQLSSQSRDYPSQGLTQSYSLLQVSPSTLISPVQVSTVPMDVCRLCVSPTSSLFPPETSRIQVPPGAGLLSLF